MATSCVLRFVVPEPYRKRTTQPGCCLFVIRQKQVSPSAGPGDRL